MRSWEQSLRCVGSTVLPLPQNARRGPCLGQGLRLLRALAPQIRVNSVNPTLVMTNMGKQVLENPDLFKRMQERHPLGKLAGQRGCGGAGGQRGAPSSSRTLRRLLPQQS